MSGIAWANVRDALPTEAEVRVFKSWGDRETERHGVRSSNPKAPSIYSYAPSATHSQWGYDIDPSTESLRWTKLELEPLGPKQELEKLKGLVEGLHLIHNLQANYRPGQELPEIPEHLTKEPEDVVRDYLTEVVDDWYGFISNDSTNLIHEVRVDLIMTHPAVRYLFLIFKR
jgi:hypothetical protein